MTKFVNVRYEVPINECYGGVEKAYRKIPGKIIKVTLINKKLIKINSNSRSFDDSSIKGCPKPDEASKSKPLMKSIKPT